MRIALALRWRLLLLWLVMLAISGALAYIIRDVYLLGSEAQTQKSLEQASQACAELQAEYTRSIKSGESIVDIALMSALLNIILDELPGVEGASGTLPKDLLPTPFPPMQVAKKKGCPIDRAQAHRDSGP